MENTLKGEFILNHDIKTDEKSATEKEARHHSKNFYNNPHFYSSFTKNPNNIEFADQEVGEEVILLLRRHLITNLPWLAFSFFLAILPFFLPIISSLFPFPQLSTGTISLFFMFYYLFIFGFVLLNFSLWYFHVGLVTNFRILDIDLAGILYRQITTTKHENVEDVTHSQIGFISSLFNYGNVHVQTAGTEVNIEFDRIPHPSNAADIIGDLSKSV